VRWYAPIETWAARRSDIMWTLFYGANWHFIDTSQDYFAQYQGTSPLLHTWSLAIEEQFYILWPLLFFAMARLFKGRRGPIAAMCAAAGVASAVRMAILLDSSGLSRSYYGTDSRIHELLVGVVLAVGFGAVARLNLDARKLTWAAAGSAAAVVAFMFLLDDTMTMYYRGGAVVFSMLVAGLIAAIELAPRGLVARGLSLPPLAWIGRISYGLYLWHWFVLITTVDIVSPPPMWEYIPLKRVTLTFAAATVSYYLIEKPIREGRVPWLRKSAPRLALAAAATLTAVAVVAVQATHIERSLAEALNDFSDSSCPNATADVEITWCVRHKGSPGSLTIATIGDSLARALDPGLIAQAELRDFTYIQAAWGGCSISGVSIAPATPLTPYDEECLSSAVSTVSDMAESARPDILIVNEIAASTRRLRVGDEWIEPLTPEHDQQLIDGFRVSFRRFLDDAPHIVVIETNQIGPTADCIRSESDEPECEPPTSTIDPINRFNDVLNSVADGFPGRVEVISTADLVCPDGFCAAFQNGMLVRFDGEHFTATYSRWIAPHVVDRVLAAAGLS
jgi:peptidoglycan/LPS O-acetylase OafA/YrhL